MTTDDLQNIERIADALERIADALEPNDERERDHNNLYNRVEQIVENLKLIG